MLKLKGVPKTNALTWEVGAMAPMGTSVNQWTYQFKDENTDKET